MNLCQDKSEDVREATLSASEQRTSNALEAENKQLKERVVELQSLLAGSNEKIIKCREILRTTGRLRLKGIGNDDDERHQGNSFDKLQVEMPSAEVILKDAVALFPEEIWTEIFAKIDDRMDLWSCSKTCLLFHRMLHKSKTTFLFPQVLPHLFRYLCGSEILEFRSICKTWKDGVDHFFENHSSLRPYQPDDSFHHPRMVPFANPMRELGLGMGYIFDTGVGGHRREPNAKFHSKIVGLPRNPIIGRSFHIVFNSTADNTYLTDLYSFLETFGHHIWYLTVTHREDRLGHPPGRLLGRMIQLFTIDLFRLVPHMRKFRIHDRLGKYPINPVMFTGQVVASLESLEIEESCITTPYVIADRIHPLHKVLLIQCHVQLRRLHVDMETWKRIFHMEWPNLVELHVKGLHKATNDFNCLTRLRTPQLGKLGVSAVKWGGKGRHSQFNLIGEGDIDSLLKVVKEEISHYAGWNTLRIRGKITVQVHDYRNQLEVFQQVPNVSLLMPPQIKTLELEYFPNMCYDFLLRFPSLESLNMFAAEPSRSWVHGGELVLTDFSTESESEGEDDREDENNESDDDSDEESQEGEDDKSVEIDKYAFGHMHRSNIWKLLPKLKLFTFNHELYTREEHEEYYRLRSKLKK